LSGPAGSIVLEERTGEKHHQEGKMTRPPIHPILDLQRRLDELFEEVIFRRWPLSSSPVPSPREWTPDVDLHELVDGFLVEVDLPGLSADQVAIEVSPKMIAISGRRLDSLPEGVVASRRERLHGSFRRPLELPEPIDVHRVEVGFRDGVLRIRAAKARAIEPNR
jgi:HSP20 family protein